MILIVFEGKNDKTYFEAIKQIFFPKKSEPFVCTYDSNIYSLYAKLKEHDVFGDGQQAGNTVSVLSEIMAEKADNPLAGIREDEVSEIYLFFDYDFQEGARTLKENNEQLQEMLAYFADETGNGKLYINYPMVESLRYTKLLPDNAYWSYTVTRQKCQEERFKHQAHEFSFYRSNLEYIILTIKPADTAAVIQSKEQRVRENWLHLIAMNVSKAHYVCCDANELPRDGNGHTQQEIFDSQLLKYVNTAECKVAILNAFPLFLYDYFGAGILQ